MNFYEQHRWWRRKAEPWVRVLVRQVFTMETTWTENRPQSYYIGFEHIDGSGVLDRLGEREFHALYEECDPPPNRRTAWGKIWWAGD